MACKDGTPYPAEWRETRAVEVATEFEVIRAQVGRALRIGSAYRTPKHNRKVGGARNSQHVQGRALDIYPPTGMSVAELHLLCRRRAVLPESNIRGLGLYPTFVHIDTRPGDNLVAWEGKRAWAEVKDGHDADTL